MMVSTSTGRSEYRVISTVTGTHDGRQLLADLLFDVRVQPTATSVVVVFAVPVIDSRGYQSRLLRLRVILRLWLLRLSAQRYVLLTDVPLRNIGRRRNLHCRRRRRDEYLLLLWMMVIVVLVVLLYCGAGRRCRIVLLVLLVVLVVLMAVRNGRHWCGRRR